MHCFILFATLFFTLSYFSIYQFITLKFEDSLKLTYLARWVNYKICSLDRKGQGEIKWEGDIEKYNNKQLKS